MLVSSVVIGLVNVPMLLRINSCPNVNGDIQFTDQENIIIGSNIVQIQLHVPKWNYYFSYSGDILNFGVKESPAKAGVGTVIYVWKHGYRLWNFILRWHRTWDTPEGKLSAPIATYRCKNRDTWRPRTEQHQNHRDPVGPIRRLIYASWLIDGQTDRQINKETYLSQYFALLRGEVMMIMIMIWWFFLASYKSLKLQAYAFVATCLWIGCNLLY